MLKGIFALILAGLIAYGGLYFFGYDFKYQNVKYYMPRKNYVNAVKGENRIHPLLVRRAGKSAASSFDKMTGDLVKQVSQSDKIEKFEKMKKDIQGIQAGAEKRAAEVEALMQ